MAQIIDHVSRNAEQIFVMFMEKTRTHGYVKGAYDVALKEKAQLALDAAEILCAAIGEREFEHQLEFEERSRKMFASVNNSLTGSIREKKVGEEP